MRSALGVIVVIGAMAVVPAAAQKDQTWKGAISDSKCNGKHPAGEHDGKKMTDVECTKVCMKNGAKVRIRVRRQGLPARQSEIANDCESRRGAGRVDRNPRGRHHHCQDHQDASDQVSGTGTGTRRSGRQTQSVAHCHRSWSFTGFSSASWKTRGSRCRSGSADFFGRRRQDSIVRARTRVVRSALWLWISTPDTKRSAKSAGTPWRHGSPRSRGSSPGPMRPPGGPSLKWSSPVSKGRSS